MMRSSIRALVTVAAVLSFQVTPAWSDEVRDAVDSGNRAFIAAVLKGDSKAASGLYTDDAKVIAPGVEIASGRPAIAAHWQKAIDAGVKDVVLTTSAVGSAGDLAYEDGVVKIVASNGEVTTARYVVVWKRTADGWKLHRDIWN
jgi:ketosteroid isomerase-like protein